MIILRDFIFGLVNYVNAIKFIFGNKLSWFFLFPLIISIALLLSGLHFSGELSNSDFEWINNKLDIEGNTADTNYFYEKLIKGVIWVIFKIAFFFVFAYTGGYIVVILLSPVLAWLSEKTEEVLCGTKYTFSLRQFLYDIVRGIRLALRNLVIELTLIIMVFMLGLLPGIGWLSSMLGLVVLFFISAYFYGFGFIDYYIERKKLNIKQSLQFIRKHKGLAIGNGFLFALVLLFPIVGALISPFLAIISVVASVITLENADIEPSF
jgi:CysZ protein